MTVIATLITEHYVQQASDRLVTFRGKAHEAEANKTVVFVARDAVVAVSYSGFAYLDGMNTDHFIAQALAGHPIDNPPSAFFGRNPSTMMPIGMAVKNLCAATHKDVDALQHWAVGLSRVDARLRARLWAAARRPADVTAQSHYPPL